MATKIARATAKLFGSGAGTNSMAVFGSLAASAPARYTGATITPALIQSLSNFLLGWTGAVMSGNAIAIEDLDSLDYLWSYQIAYLLQEGIAEYDSGTTYWTNSICQSGGILYQSLVDNNINNTPSTSPADWTSQLAASGSTQTTTYTVGQTDKYVRLNTTSAGFTATLPAIASTPTWKEFKFKNVGSAGNNGTLAAHSGDLIDGAVSIVLRSTPVLDSVTIINNGVGWDII